MHKSNLAPQGADVMENLIEVKLTGRTGASLSDGHILSLHRLPRKSFQRCLNQIEGFKEYLREAHENGIGFRLVDGDADGMSL
jgi:hypothetical protein